jgi:diguanylate cyclase (GGDEF)-like protein
MSDQSSYEKLQQRKQLIQKTDHLIKNVAKIYLDEPLQAYEQASIAYHLSVSGPFVDEPYLVGVANSLHALSRINLLWKKLGLALAQANNSQKIAELLKDQGLVLRNSRLLAEIYYLLYNFEKAEEIFTQIHMAPKADNFRDLEVEALQFLSQMALQEKKILKAQGHILKSIDLCKKYNLNALIGNSYLIYCRVCLAVGDLANAAFAVSRAISVSQQDHYPLIYVQSLDILGTMDLRMGKYPEAELNFSLMATYALRHKMQEEYLQALLGICLVKQHTGDEKAYLETLQEMASLPYLEEHHELRSKVHLLFSQYYETKKEYKLALTHYKKYFSTQQIWQQKQLTENLQALEAIHQTDSVLSEVEIASEINAKLNTEIQERKWAEKELRKSEAKFRDLAIMDSLTGLYNRHYFYQVGQKEVERSLRYQLPLSLIMMDIDHYKEINDQYGHRVGDMVLTQIGQIIQNAVRKIDIACRYGGEEFVILLPETELEQAERVAERIRGALDEATISLDAQSVTVTASLGIVDLSASTPLIEEMLAKADDAMYRAKEKGRNQIVSCPYSQPS